MRRALWCALAGLASAAPARANEPAAVPDFLLESTDGARVSLQREQAGRALTVLVFLDVDCGVTKQLAKELGERERQYRAQGVRFLGIDPDRGDGGPTLSAFAAEH